MNIALYGGLTWYLDRIIPDEFGSYQPPWFFILPSFWGIHFKGKETEAEWIQKQKKLKGEIFGDDSSAVIEEKFRTLNPGNI